MQSPVGRNYMLCYERYAFKVDEEFRFGLKSSCCSRYVSMQLSFTDCCHIAFAVELIMLRSVFCTLLGTSGVWHKLSRGIMAVRTFDLQLNTSTILIVCWLLLTRVIIHSFYFLLFYFFFFLMCILCVQFSL